MSTNVIIIALIGKSGSGKSTIEREISKCDADYYGVAFATPLKKACSELFLWKLENLNNGPRTKECTKWLEFDVNVSPRSALQKMGDFVRNNIDQKFFSKFLKRHLEDLKLSSLGGAVVCIQDMRFFNEYVFLKDLCKEKNWEFMPILIDRSTPDEIKLNSEQQAHISETSFELIRDYDPTIPIFNNNGSLDNLHKEIFQFINNIKKSPAKNFYDRDFFPME